MWKFWIRLIAILEIVGGLYGPAFVVWQYTATPPDNRNVPFALIAFAVYLFCLIAGIALLVQLPFGRIAPIIVQVIQLPKYFSQLLIFMFSFGFTTGNFRSRRWSHEAQRGPGLLQRLLEKNLMPQSAMVAVGWAIFFSLAR